MKESKNVRKNLLTVLAVLCALALGIAVGALLLPKDAHLPPDRAPEQDLMTTLEVCYEFYLRGFQFETINIYESDATRFKVTENGLLPPFTSVRGLGETAAIDTVEKRQGKEFISIEEFSLCCNKLSKTHIEQLKKLGAFAGMADTSQITLF